MTNWPFSQGVQAIGNGLYGYIQPDGTWGWSNAGLVVSDDATLLIDTLMSVPLTRDMLDAFDRQVGVSKIDRVMNTHANPDHFFGNQLVADAEIIATEICAREMAEFDPKMLSSLRDHYHEMGDAGAFLYETMGRKFDFSGVDAVTLPNRTFHKQLTLTVGSKTVELLDLGPAHTGSDTIAYLPDDKTVFTGDLLFNEGTPIMWDGPIENWITACDYICGLDVDVVVPGHGPITDKQAVRNLKAYFEYIRAEARARFDAGIGWEEAARDINLREFRGWSDPERIVANVFSLYRAWGVQHTPEESRTLFGAMGRYHKALAAHEAGCTRHHSP